MSEKIFCGSGKKVTDKKFAITINPDKIKDYIEEYKGNKFVKLIVDVLDEPDRFGKTVSVTINTWKPQPKDGEEMTF